MYHCFAPPLPLNVGGPLEQSSARCSALEFQNETKMSRECVVKNISNLDDGSADGPNLADGAGSADGALRVTVHAAFQASASADAIKRP